MENKMSVANQPAAATSAANNNNNKQKKTKTIEETYTKKTQLEHILLRPDTYVGSVEKQTQPMWVYDTESEKIVQRPCTFVPGLYKIFDEIIVNASDNKQRDRTMSRIDVTLNAAENFIRVWNNGNGIPIVLHQEHHIYVPELIFGHLLTGSNFDDDEDKTTGGRNGYGAKLANIFSTRFIVETSDKTRKLKYKQEFTENMKNKSNPEIQSSSGDDFTCVTFYPDLRRFKMDHLDEDILALLSKRVYDIAATNMAGGAKLNVYLNGKKIETRDFEQYISIYKGLEPPCGFEKVGERWEIGVGVSDGTFQQVSFVNSICTTKGGCHVNYIADQITSRLAGVVKKRNKGEEVRPNQIKNHLAVYVNALITNPSFDSQTKENLTTKASAFGSTCIVPEKLFKQVEKSGIIDSILNWAKFKQNAELKKKSGSKRSKLTGITKLDDANNAGTSKSKNCTLILTEGDSAKALAISGLGVVGRDDYGVFPLRGKLLNVREANHSQIMKNEEIQNIAKILGLSFGKDYTDTSSLRYGHLMIMTDQDHDGSHIKGLLINFLHHFWPSLLKIEGFLQQFITPIVKCTKGNKEHVFFTIPEYHNWKEANNDGKGFKIKYYKGLGTSTSAEAKQYFSHLQTHKIDFDWDEQADDMVDMAFAKKRVDDRKLWLLNMEPGVFIDYGKESVTYNEFVNRELILFSHADNERSIPHFMDGFKPSQRKVLFSCLKRNLKQEIKVAQLAGYISEHSAYHHGEASLTQTIIGMAQNFVGSNNINLLSPCGQFGTRLMGGKDAASARYVFTKLEPITRCIFHPDDDALLNYLDDDGQSIEPSFYAPVIPMSLVNGSEGIGTGWSTNVPTYNPREIITNLRRILAGQQPVEMKPWYRGFIGEIEAKNNGNFVVAGIIDQLDEENIRIRELPVGKWTTDYKQYLETMVIGATASAAAKEDGNNTPAPAIIKDFKENHTDTTVSFTITMPADKLAELINDKQGIHRKLKLESSISTTNMHFFDLNSQIKKFETASDILFAFYDVRVDFYQKRKAHLIRRLTEEWEQLDNKVRFILDVISGKIVVSNRKKNDIMLELKKLGYKPFPVHRNNNNNKNDDDDASVDSEENPNKTDVETTTTDLDKGYDYLLSMKIWSLTRERVVALTQQRDGKKNDLEILEKKTPEMLWEEDLTALENALDAFEAEFVEAERTQKVAANKARSDKAKAGNKQQRKQQQTKNYGSDFEVDDDDDDDFDFDDDSSVEVKKKKPSKAKATTTTGKKGTGQTVSAATMDKVGTIIPRKIVVDKPPSQPREPKAPKLEETKPRIKKEGKTTTTTTTTKGEGKQKRDVYDMASDDDEDNSEPKVLSLMERLAMKKGGSTTATTTTTTGEVKVAGAAKKPRAKKAVNKKSKDSDDDDDDDNNNSDEDENDVVVVKPISLSRAPRAAAQAKKTFVDFVDDSDEDANNNNDDDEDDDDVASQDSSVFGESDNDDDDDNFSDSSPSNKKKNKNKSTKTKTVTTTKTTASTAPSAPPTTTAAAPKRAKKTALNNDDEDDDVVVVKKPVKRQVKQISKKKSSDDDDDDDDDDGNKNGNNAAAAVDDDDDDDDIFVDKAPLKKAKKTTTTTTTTAPKAPKVPKADQPPKEKKPRAKAATTTKESKPKAAAGPKKSKKRSLDSDDDDDDDDGNNNSEDEEEEVVAVKRTPKPSRQRKQINFAQYYDSEEDEDD